MMLLGALSALLTAAVRAAATCAWLLVGRARGRPRPARHPRLGAQAALRRHPAWRAMQERGAPVPQARQGTLQGAPRPAGPDDDPDFIRALERLIRGGGPDQPG
jgi:hypothetical protein